MMCKSDDGVDVKDVAKTKIDLLIAAMNKLAAALEQNHTKEPLSLPVSTLYPRV